MEGVAARAIRDATSCQQTGFLDSAEHKIKLSPGRSLAYNFLSSPDLLKKLELPMRDRIEFKQLLLDFCYKLIPDLSAIIFGFPILKLLRYF